MRAALIAAAAALSMLTPASAQSPYHAELFNFTSYTLTIRDNGVVKCVLESFANRSCFFDLSVGSHRIEVTASETGVTLTNNVQVPDNWDSASAGFYDDCQFTSAGCADDEDW